MVKMKQKLIIRESVTEARKEGVFLFVKIMSWHWLILSIFVTFNVYTSYSQGINVCLAVNGSQTGWTANVLTSTSYPAVYCPNLNTGYCVFLVNTEGVTATYNVNNGKNLRFEIDYELDELYGSSDRTEIYYNCDGTKRFLYSVSQSKRNANINTEYRKNPVPLPAQYCDQVSSVAISIEQTRVNDSIIYFNFQNACIYGDTISPTLVPTNDPTNDPTYRPSDHPTMEPTVIPTKMPTITPTKLPTKDPTNNPTYTPSENPTMEPTNDPTNDPTSNPTLSSSYRPTDSLIITNNTENTLLKRIKFLLVISVILFGITAVLCIAIFIYYKKIKSYGLQETQKHNIQSKKMIEIKSASNIVGADESERLKPKSESPRLSVTELETSHIS